MSETDSDNELAGIVIKIGEKRKSLQIKGLGFVHPMHEALIALLRNYLGDGSIVQRYVKDEQALRNIIATDAMMDNVPSGERAGIERALADNQPLERIVELASLAIVGNKRLIGGRLMVPLSQKSELNENKYTLKSLGEISLDNVYVPESEVEKVVKGNEHRKKVRKGYLIAGAIGIGLLGLGAYVISNNVSLDFALKNPFDEKQISHFSYGLENTATKDKK